MRRSRYVSCHGSEIFGWQQTTNVVNSHCFKLYPGGGGGGLVDQYLGMGEPLRV